MSAEPPWLWRRRHPLCTPRLSHDTHDCSLDVGSDCMRTIDGLAIYATGSPGAMHASPTVRLILCSLECRRELRKIWHHSLCLAMSLFRLLGVCTLAIFRNSTTLPNRNRHHVRTRSGWYRGISCLCIPRRRRVGQAIQKAPRK
jgi:hypothetical protein